MYSVHFETIGCRLNQLESEAAAGAFAAAGFSVDMENASAYGSKTAQTVLCIVNTCTVTSKAEQKARRVIRLLLGKYPDFAEKFSSTISIPVFTNDELVAFARVYCAENKCQMDELGVLALYSLISNGQTEDHPMTISEVKEILDVAMSKAKRGGRRGRKSANKGKMITLYEKDFA